MALKVGIVSTLAYPALAGPAWPACIAACMPSGAGGPGAYSACCIVCGGLTCFEDNTTMVKVSEHCGGQEVPSEDCLSRQAVQDFVPGDLVLAEDVSGALSVTKIVHNSRHVGFANSVTIRVNSSGSSPLTVTGNHLLMSRSSTESEYYLRRADSIVVGETVSVNGEPSQVTHVEHAELDHRNHLVTASGTVLANGVHVSTVCEDYAKDKFAGFPAAVGLAAWRSSHEMDRLSEIV